jgi:hypothetical protein
LLVAGSVIAVSAVALISESSARPISTKGTFVSLLRLCRHSQPCETTTTSTN